MGCKEDIHPVSLEEEREKALRVAAV